MQKFMAIFTATQESRARSDWGQLDANTVQARRAEGVKAWNDWAERNKAAIVDPGSPIGKTKRVDPAGPSDGAKATPPRLQRFGAVLAGAAASEALARPCPRSCGNTRARR